MPLAIEYIWRDRKRYLGMPISFTRYSMSEDRLFLSTGLLTTHEDEVILYRVRDISVKITLFQRIFGVGTVTVISSDKTMPTLELKSIKRPREVKELLHRQVEEIKRQRRMRIGEVMTDTDPDDDPEDDFDFRR